MLKNYEKNTSVKKVMHKLTAILKMILKLI